MSDNKIEKLSNLLKKQLNIRILSVWTEKTKCCFLFCLDSTGCTFFLDVQGYNIFILDDIRNNYCYEWNRYYIQSSSSSYDELSNQFYENYITLFPKYLNRIVFYIDDYLVFNQQSVYKVVQSTDLSGSILLFPKFQFDWLYDNKLHYTTDILTLNDDMLRKVEFLSNRYVNELSTLLPEGFLESASNEITDLQHTVDQDKKLLISMNSFENQLQQELKKLEDFSIHRTIHDTKKQIQQKTKKKQKLSSIEKLRKQAIKNLLLTQKSFLHKLSTYLFYKSDLDKQIISVNSKCIEFTKKFC